MMQERVVQDINPKLTVMLGQFEGQFRTAITTAYTNALSEKDATDLLSFMKTDDGKRYQDFQNSLDASIGHGISEMGKISAGKGTMPSATNDQNILQSRLQMLALARLLRITAKKMEAETNGVDHGEGTALVIMAQMTASLVGADLDALAIQYKDDLPRFKMIADSALEKKFIAANVPVIDMKTWMQLTEQMTALLDGVKNARLSEWKTYYAELGSHHAN